MKQEAQFTFGGETYLIGHINAIEQFHLFRRLSPLIATMGVELLRFMTNKGEGAEGLTTTDWAVMAAPMLGEIAKMPQDDVNYIIQHGLAVVRLKDVVSGGWAPLLTPQGQLMHQALGMVAMLRIILEVMRHNLGDFFTVPQADASF